MIIVLVFPSIFFGHMTRANFVHALILYSYRIDFPQRTLRPLFFDGNLIDRYFIAIIENKKKRGERKEEEEEDRARFTSRTKHSRIDPSCQWIRSFTQNFCDIFHLQILMTTRINIERRIAMFSFSLKKTHDENFPSLLLKNVYTSTGNTIRRPVIRCYSSFFLRFFFFEIFLVRYSSVYRMLIKFME